MNFLQDRRFFEEEQIKGIDDGKNSEYLYLDKLTFDPNLKKSWMNFFLTHFRVIALLLVLLTAWGVYSFIELPLESMPEVKIPVAVVITTYPGASPSDIEELVTKKIEAEVSGLKDIDTITSESSNSISSVVVQFNADTDVSDSIRQLRDSINNIADLPGDASAPMVREISLDDSPIFSVSLFGPFDGFTLRRYAEDIQSELEKIAGVREVNISGGDQSEFEVAYDPGKLALFSITADQANQIIKATNIVIPVGSVEGEKYTYPVRADARFFNAEKLKNIPIMHTGEGAIVYLKDIATVGETAIKKTVYSHSSTAGSQPQNSVTISVVKKTGGSIADTGDQAKATIEAMIKNMPSDLRYNISIDSSEQIKDDFNGLVRDFIITIILVFLLLFLIVGLKEALVAGMSVPLIFLATFGIMLQTDVSLNFLSMFSLILALGLLVDDAIVAVTATKQYMRTGKFTPEEAVLLVFRDFKTVLVTTTLTTVWAFIPLISSSGIIGQFIRSIPITVSITLISSLIIAFVINLPLTSILERVRLTRKIFLAISLTLFALGVALIFTQNYYAYGLVLVIFIVLTRMVKWYTMNKNKLAENSELMEAENKDPELIKKKLTDKGDASGGWWQRCLSCGLLSLDKVLPYYEKYLSRLIATKKSRRLALTVVGVLFLTAIALPATGIVKSEFFPVADFDFIYINITAPVGTNLDETNKVVERVEEKLLKYEEFSNFSSVIGNAGSVNSFESALGNSSHKAQLTIRLKNQEERTRKSYVISEDIRKDLADITDAKIEISLPKAGPPSGSDFEARISGDDLQVLDQVAHELEPYLAAIKGVVSTDISLKNSPAEYTFALDADRMELYGLNAAYVGSVLRMAVSGTEISTVLMGGDEIKVVARFDENKIRGLSDIENLQILNLYKQPVYLKDVAKVELKPSVETISRIDQKRTVLLSGTTDAKANPTEVVAEFKKRIKADYRLPDGYEITYGGQNEQNNESVLSIIRAMLISLLLIVSTLVIQFNSFKKSIIVLVTIPLALIGVFFGLALTGLTLSFPGLIGILALFGIVVKNAIILVDKINLNVKAGIPFQEAIIDAGKSRLEAIVITSVCTIIGIIPITLSNETWMALGGAVIFGLMLSSFLTLFVVPILFMTFIKDEKAAQKS